jgi:hypothetical protein
MSGIHKRSRDFLVASVYSPYDGEQRGCPRYCIAGLSSVGVRSRSTFIGVSAKECIVVGLVLMDRDSSGEALKAGRDASSHRSTDTVLLSSYVLSIGLIRTKALTQCLLVTTCLEPLLCTWTGEAA